MYRKITFTLDVNGNKLIGTTENEKIRQNFTKIIRTQIIIHTFFLYLIHNLLFQILNCVGLAQHDSTGRTHDEG